MTGFWVDLKLNTKSFVEINLWIMEATRRSVRQDRKRGSSGTGDLEDPEETISSNVSGGEEEQSKRLKSKSRTHILNYRFDFNFLNF